MPIVFGEDVRSVEAIVGAFREHGDRIRGAYRARYLFDPRTIDPYAAARIERPESLRDNPTTHVFPWEQVLLAAANCVGSDYPMLAAHFGVDLERVELSVDCEFDPRGEFDGLLGYNAPDTSRHCYLSLHIEARIHSPAPYDALAALHRRVVDYNMVLGALRGIPMTDTLVTCASLG
jgi:uncharacterized OsmC-like protein